jgi:selenoprotein W-related protein
LAEQILIEYKKDISEFTLVPSDGGRFEIELNGQLIFSKVAEGRYPAFDEIKTKINAIGKG